VAGVRAVMSTIAAAVPASVPDRALAGPTSATGGRGVSATPPLPEIR